MDGYFIAGLLIAFTVAFLLAFWLASAMTAAQRADLIARLRRTQRERDEARALLPACDVHAELVAEQFGGRA